MCIITLYSLYQLLVEKMGIIFFNKKHQKESPILLF